MLRALPALLLALACAASTPGVASARARATVVVKDAYLDLHTGPGRGYPSTYSVERDATVELLRRRTDWIKVRTPEGREGWVHRSQLERTLTPQGDGVRLPGPSPDAPLQHRWETGLATGDFGGANVVSLNGSWVANPHLLLRADVSQLLGTYSDGWLGTLGIAHLFAPQWRVSPFVGLGGGLLTISPKATLVQSEDRSDSTAYAGVGVRGFLTQRFMLQAEYRSYVVFTSRDENEEIDAWTVAFAYYF